MMNDAQREAAAPMTPESAREKLLEIARRQGPPDHDSDIEQDHEQADGILCALLRALGHGDVADAFLATQRWYS